MPGLLAILISNQRAAFNLKFQTSSVEGKGNKLDSRWSDLTCMLPDFFIIIIHLYGNPDERRLQDCKFTPKPRCTETVGVVCQGQFQQ